MEKEFQNKKRERNDYNSSEDSEENNTKKVKMPDKSNYRGRAHCNPLSDLIVS